MTKRLLLLLFPLALLFLSCPEDEPLKLAEGSVFVLATLDGDPLADVTVTTEPPTKTVVTDPTGTALLQEVAAGTYRVLANRSGLPPQALAATVRTDVVTQLEFTFTTPGGGGGGGGGTGGDENRPPYLALNLDGSGEFYEGYTIRLTGLVTDDRDPVQTLAIALSSSLDGVLDTVFADPGSGRFAYETEELTPGLHTLIATVTDADGAVGSEQLTLRVYGVPQPIRIDTILPAGGGTEVRWNACDCERLAYYVIEKALGDSTGEFRQIGQVDPQITTYVDEDLAIGQTAYYRVNAVLGYYDGPVVTGVARGYVLELDAFAIGTGIVRMKADPQRPYIYGLDRVNNELLFINLEEERVEKSIYVGSAPVDLAFSRGGDSLFVANFGSTLIAIVDLNAREKVGDLSVNTQGGVWDGNPYRLAVMAGNRLVYTSEDQWNDLKLVDIATGERLFNTGSIYQPGLLTNAAGTVLYVTESGSTGSSVIRYNLQNDELVQVSQSNPEVNFGSRDATLTADGKYIYYGTKKLLASNLDSQLGTFPEAIVTANGDGSIAVGSTALFDGETFQRIGSLPVSSQISVVSPDDASLYLFHSGSSYLIKIDLTTF